MRRCLAIALFAGWVAIALLAAGGCLSPLGAPADKGSPSAGTGAASLDVVLALVQEREKQYAKQFETIESSIEVALAAAKELSQTAAASAATATLKSEASTDKRFEAANELRGALLDAQTKFASKDEVAAKFDGIVARLDAIQKAQDRMAGQSEGGEASKDDNRSTWAIVLAALGLIVAVAAAFVIRRKP